MIDSKPMRSLVEFAIGGGWGSEQPEDGLVPVSIIRGADFPDVEQGDYAGLPLRYEKASKVTKRRLMPGDIVLEVSGGTKDRPTGRAVFVSQASLDRSAATLIPASFCRLIRPDSDEVDSKYLYYWLVQMHRDGRTWGYQVQSTGLANFQFETFLDAEEVRLPPLQEQRRIAGVLGALDDLIDTNRGLVAVLDAQLRLGHRALLGKGPVAEVGLFDAFEIDFGDPFRGTGFCEPGSGLPLLRIRDLKTYAPQVWTTERIPGDTLVQPGDLLVGMDAEFRPTFWLGEPALLNQRVCRVRPRTGSVAFAREAIRGPLAYIEGYKTGTTVIHLNKRDLADARVQMPDPEHLAQYDSAAVPIHSAIVALDRENEALRRTRDELLPLLLSGRVSPGEVAA